ncbi:uncharacterized protein LOC143034299 [Oratosquilla oratoria]|uniref:uncharacterized protein LOC143034299 n=1 Tax=Oratosquilla oratoria TaxID=337810 RepID=UPI003F75F8A2
MTNTIKGRRNIWLKIILTFHNDFSKSGANIFSRGIKFLQALIVLRPKDANCRKPRLAHIKGSPTAHSVSLQSAPHSLQVLLVPSRRHTLFDMKLTLMCLALATVFASSWGLPSPDPEASFGYGSPYGGRGHGGLVGSRVVRPVVQPIVRTVVRPVVQRVVAPVVHRVVSPVSHGVSYGRGYGK